MIESNLWSKITTRILTRPELLCVQNLVGKAVPDRPSLSVALKEGLFVTCLFLYLSVLCKHMLKRRHVAKILDILH